MLALSIYHSIGNLPAIPFYIVQVFWLSFYTLSIHLYVFSSHSLALRRYSQDARLIEAISLYGKDWNKVKVHVGGEATCDRCWQRWNRSVSI